VKNKYSFEGRVYSVISCTKEDIPSHTERVLSYWESAKVNISTQIKLLEKCIEQGTAYKVVDDEGKDRAGIYYIARKGLQSGDCYYMFLDNKRMLAILCYYLRMRVCLDTLYFLPHTKGFIPFRFLVDESSIRDFNCYGFPLEIKLSSQKSRYLYEDHYVRYGIKEIDDGCST